MGQSETLFSNGDLNWLTKFLIAGDSCEDDRTYLKFEVSDEIYSGTYMTVEVKLGTLVKQPDMRLVKKTVQYVRVTTLTT